MAARVSRLVGTIALALVLSMSNALLRPTPSRAAVFEGFYGYVTDAETGAPLSGMFVYLVDDSTGITLEPVKQTNASGYYEFTAGYPDDTYRIAFGKAGYAFQNEGLFVHTGIQQHRVDHKAWSLAHRAWGPTRYSTAVEIARVPDEQQPMGPSWVGVTHVVIASGDDRAAADPLAASGLCWLYRAPLFLVSASSTPQEVKQAVAEIANANGSVTLHVVGGPTSVPSARVNDLVNYVQAHTAFTATAERVRSDGNRYDLAASIARRVCGSPAWSKDVLVANGADPDKFFDALALSPAARAAGRPILLVSGTSLPSATKSVLADVDPHFVVVAGGVNTVASGVFDGVKASAAANTERWWGANRYSTAAVIATNSVNKGWLDWDGMGVAAKLPDALTGGAALGRLRYPLLLVKKGSLPAETAACADKLSGSDPCYVFGGPDSVKESVRLAILARLMAP
ncbi:MAG: cell wall-binding repeat-containing protein [Actinomycetota bacterium]|nr:cell wall-binding repeat-containing protein [Actinomycetota bacterium]